MTKSDAIETWKRIAGTDEEGRWFPEYFVSQPPHREGLEPVYFKVVSPNGPVFWREEGDDSGRSTSFYDLLMEEKNGYGLQRINREYTPWGDNQE